MLGQLVIILLAVVVVKSNDECDPDAFGECLPDDLYPVFQLGPQLPDEGFLNKYCRPGIETAECFRDEARKCPDIVAIARLLPDYEEIIELIHPVCDEGSEIRKGYLANLGCYNRSLLQTKECAERVVKVVHTFLQKIRNDTEFELLREEGYCLYDRVVVKCAVKSSTALCGAEGTVPLENVLNLLHSINNVGYCNEETQLVLEARLLTHMVEIGYELKKKRRK